MIQRFLPFSVLALQLYGIHASHPDHPDIMRAGSLPEDRDPYQTLAACSDPISVFRNLPRFRSPLIGSHSTSIPPPLLIHCHTSDPQPLQHSPGLTYCTLTCLLVPVFAFVFAFVFDLVLVCDCLALSLSLFV